VIIFWKIFINHIPFAIFKSGLSGGVSFFQNIGRETFITVEFRCPVFILDCRLFDPFHLSISHREIAAISQRVVALMKDLGYNRFQLYAKINIDPKKTNDFYVMGESPRPRHIEIIAEKTGYGLARTRG